MHFRLKNRQVQLEHQVVVLVLLCLAWTFYYYFSTVAVPDGGSESVLFIKPLTIILVISAFFVVASAVKVTPAPRVPEKSPEKPEDRGILHPQRLTFALSLFVYAAALPYFGYLLSSLVYLIGMSLFLGLRNFWVLFGLTAGYTALLWIGFKKLMYVPIPIWPTFM